MEEIDMDFHDEESSFDAELEVIDLDYEDCDDAEEELEKTKELIFYRRLEDY